MKWSARPSRFALVTLCSLLIPACQTQEPGYLTSTTVTEKLITKDSMCQVAKPILVSRSDVLTTDTAEQVGDHNNVVWCTCPEKRPQGFDAKVCKAG